MLNKKSLRQYNAKILLISTPPLSNILGCHKSLSATGRLKAFIKYLFISKLHVSIYDKHICGQKRISEKQLDVRQQFSIDANWFPRLIQKISGKRG
jgi:hypothetical protein